MVKHSLWLIRGGRRFQQFNCLPPLANLSATI